MTASVRSAPTASPGSSAPVRLPVSAHVLRIGPTGETFEFAASARTSADRTFRFVWTLAPGKTGPGQHFHDSETETFEVVSGTIRIWLDGAPKDYGPGDVLVVKPGQSHRFLNPGTEPVVINVSLDGTRMEDALVPLGVASQGRALSLGDMLRMVAGLDANPSTPTSAVERAVVHGLARALRAVGVRPLPPVIGWDARA